MHAPASYGKMCSCGTEMIEKHGYFYCPHCDRSCEARFQTRGATSLAFNQNCKKCMTLYGHMA